MSQTSYQLICVWVQPKSIPFTGWFSGDGLPQAIDAGLKAARECGCKLEVKQISVLARKRRRGEV